MKVTVEDVLAAIRLERKFQDEKWGEQNHHPLLWFSIIGEEYGEMCCAYNEYTFDKKLEHIEKVKAEAIQVAASCVAMVECLNRHSKKGFIPDSERGKEQGV